MKNTMKTKLWVFDETDRLWLGDTKTFKLQLIGRDLGLKALSKLFPEIPGKSTHIGNFLVLRQDELDRQEQAWYC